MPALFIAEADVTEEFQQQGIASEMMRRIFEIGHEHKCEQFWVTTEDDNIAARALYNKLGGDETKGVVMYEWGDDSE